MTSGVFVNKATAGNIPTNHLAALLFSAWPRASAVADWKRVSGSAAGERGMHPGDATIYVPKSHDMPHRNLLQNRSSCSIYIECRSLGQSVAPTTGASLNDAATSGVILAHSAPYYGPDFEARCFIIE